MDRSRDVQLGNCSRDIDFIELIRPPPRKISYKFVKSWPKCNPRATKRRIIERSPKLSLQHGKTQFLHGGVQQWRVIKVAKSSSAGR